MILGYIILGLMVSVDKYLSSGLNSIGETCSANVTSIKLNTKFSFLTITCETNFDILKIFKGITGNHNIKHVQQMYKYWV